MCFGTSIKKFKMITKTKKPLKQFTCEELITDFNRDFVEKTMNRLRKLKKVESNKRKQDKLRYSRNLYRKERKVLLKVKKMPGDEIVCMYNNKLYTMTEVKLEMKQFSEGNVVTLPIKLLREVLGAHYFNNTILRPNYGIKNNTEKVKVDRLKYNRDYYQKNKDKILKNQLKHYLKNRDKILLRQREYYKKSKERVKNEAIK
jgi:hypothetical protein